MRMLLALTLSLLMEAMVLQAILLLMTLNYFLSSLRPDVTYTIRLVSTGEDLPSEILTDTSPAGKKQICLLLLYMYI